jgi:hypothetical protein
MLFDGHDIRRDMSYAERQVARAYQLVAQFAHNKMYIDAPPDLVHHQIEIDYNSRSKKFFDIKNNVYGWVIATGDDQCVLGLEDGGVLIGHFKLRSQFLLRSRTRAENYAYWREYNKDKTLAPYIAGPRELPVEIAEIIIKTLDTKFRDRSNVSPRS